MTSPLDPDDLRTRLRAIPAEALRQLLADAVAPPTPPPPEAPDGSRVLRVVGPAGTQLSYRLSADDWNL